MSENLKKTIELFKVNLVSFIKMTQAVRTLTPEEHAQFIEWLDEAIKNYGGAEDE